MNHSPVVSWRRASRIKPLMLGGVIVVAVAVTAVIAPWLAPRHPLQQVLPDALTPPGAKYVLGSDELGRDVLSRILWGSRPSLLIAGLSVSLAAFAGTVLGLAAGYFGGATDRLIVRLLDILLTFPAIILAVVFVGIFRIGDAGLVIALVLALAPRFARVARAQTLSLKERDFVEAARALGTTDARIIRLHVLPNMIGPLIILASVLVPATVFLEATLSFLGLGVSPDITTWGRIIADGRQYLLFAPWIAISPGIMLAVTALGFNLLGDGLRDLLDIHIRA